MQKQTTHISFAQQHSELQCYCFIFSLQLVFLTTFVESNRTTKVKPYPCSRLEDSATWNHHAICDLDLVALTSMCRYEILLLIHSNFLLGVPASKLGTGKCSQGRMYPQALLPLISSKVEANTSFIFNNPPPINSTHTSCHHLLPGWPN